MEVNSGIDGNSSRLRFSYQLSFHQPAWLETFLQASDTLTLQNCILNYMIGNINVARLNRSLPRMVLLRTDKNTP